MSVDYEKKGRVAIIRLNRPEVLNAIDHPTSEELTKVWEDFRDDPELWVAILTGTGEKAFCAGADLKAMAAGKLSRKGLAFGGNTQGMEIWKPMIAAINGLALGGGLEIALVCDLRIAVEDAYFGLPEVGVGLIPGAGGLIRLPRTIPLGKAMELILMNKRMSAQEALQIGLVNKVVPLSDLMPTALEWANQICELSPLAVRASKECAYRSLDMELKEALALDDVFFHQIIETRDYQEGVRAFVEKRKPSFEAR